MTERPLAGNPLAGSPVAGNPVDGSAGPAGAMPGTAGRPGMRLSGRAGVRRVPSDGLAVGLRQEV
jgi:hypothetical protein